jgi:hypothetical protein
MSRLSPEAVARVRAAVAAMPRPTPSPERISRLAAVLDAITRERLRKAASGPPRAAEGADR